MRETIREAAAPGDHSAFGALTAEYVAWIRARYADDAAFVEQVFEHQDLRGELRTLADTYGPPHGRTLLAWRDGAVCGGGAYRRLADGSCELKRLFVPDRCRGRGLGLQLARALIDSARAHGYAVMRLDTGHRFVEAIALYRKLGFRDSAPHLAYPPQLLPHLAFMELSLAAPA